MVNLTKFFTAQKNLSHLELHFNYTTIYDLWIQEIFESMSFVDLKSLTLGLRSCGLDNPCVMRLAAMIGTIEVKESLSIDLGGYFFCVNKKIETRFWKKRHQSYRSI